MQVATTGIERGGKPLEGVGNDNQRRHDQDDSAVAPISARAHGVDNRAPAEGHHKVKDIDDGIHHADGGQRQGDHGGQKVCPVVGLETDGHGVQEIADAKPGF